MTKVLLVDDSQLSLYGIKTVLKNENISIAGETSSGREAIHLAAQEQPDIVILDLYLSDTTGMYVCSEISRKYPKIKTIYLTASHCMQTFSRLIKTPAAGILTKQAPSHLIFEAFNEVMKGKRYIQPDLAWELLDYVMNQGNHKLNSISNKDYEILLLLSQGKTNETISEYLSINSKTVSNRRTKSMQQLGVKSIDELRHLFFDSANSRLVELFQKKL